MDKLQEVNDQNHKYHAALAQIDVGETYIKQLFDYYHQCFVESDWACMFVENAVAIPNDLKEHSFPCLCLRKLSMQIDSRRTLEGGAIRGALQQDGLLLATGGELFRGCIVFPDIDENDHISSPVGYRFAKRIRRGKSPVVHWQRPESEHLITQSMTTIQEVIHEKANF